MTDPLMIQLPVPPSANRYWRTYRNRAVVSDEAKAYKADVLWHVRESGVYAPPFPAGDVCVSIQWYRGRKSGDVDNRAKCLLDSLNGLIWTDDAQIARLTIERFDTQPKAPCMMVTVDVISNLCYNVSNRNAPALLATAGGVSQHTERVSYE